jgi:hypothetical protein
MATTFVFRKAKNYLKLQITLERMNVFNVMYFIPENLRSNKNKKVLCFGGYSIPL